MDQIVTLLTWNKKDKDKFIVLKMNLLLQDYYLMKSQNQGAERTYNEVYMVRGVGFSHGL
jgi:hypothetical protein